jgi:hypothetical protein
MAEQIGVNINFTDTGLKEIDKNLANVSKEIKEIGKSASDALGNTNTSAGQLGTSFGSLSSILSVAGGALAGFSIAEFGLNAIQAAERLKVLKDTLKRVSEGDADAANSKFAELAKIADELGIKNNELVGTYNTLATKGFKPTGDEMRKLIDIAKASNKDIDQLAEAVLDAQTGEFERLKEFGIKASKANGEVSFSFNGVTKTVKDTADEINKAVLSFGNMASIQGVAASQSDGLTAAQNRLSNAQEALFANIGSLGIGAASGFVGAISSMVSATNDAIFPQQALNREFDATLSAVINTQNTVPKLVDRYDFLKKQTSLNKKEQAEMNGLISELSGLYPDAIGQVDAFSKILDINTDIIRSNNKEQRESLLELTRLKLIQEETTNATLRESVQGLRLNKETGENVVTILTDVGEITERTSVNQGKNNQNLITANTAFIKSNDEIAKFKKIIDQLTKNETVTIEKNTEAKKKNVAASGDDKEAKKKADELAKLIEKAKADAEKANAKIGESNEEIILKQKALELKNLADEQKAIVDLAKSLGKKVDVSKEFGLRQLAIEEEFRAKIRAARQKDIETAVDVKAITEPLKNALNDIDFAQFKDKSNNALAKALLDPKSFEDEFKKVNKSAELGAEELSAIIQNLVTTVDGDLSKISNPLERLKLEILKAFKIDEKQLELIIDTFSQLTSSIFAFYKAQNDAAVKASEDKVKRYDADIAATEKRLDVELARQKEGSANNVENEKEKLKTLQSERDAADKKGQEAKEKATKLQLIQDGIQQGSALVTTIANIYSGFSKLPIVGLILGIAAVASFILAFSAAKSKVTKLKGGGRMGGNLHTEGGNDMGNGYETERGEWVVNGKDSSEQDKFISRVNAGEFRGKNLDAILSKDNPLLLAVRQSRSAVKMNHENERQIMSIAFSQAIANQTKQLIDHDITKPVIVPTAEGYMEIERDLRGNTRKRITKVN